MLGKKKATSAYKGNDYKDHSFIASQTEVTGDIRFIGGLHVEGKVSGNIISEEGALHVHGEVVGEIRVPHVVINGTVRGNIYASEHIELAAKAVVNGNVYYRTMEMMMGAQINGSLLHSDKPAVQQLAEDGAAEAGVERAAGAENG